MAVTSAAVRIITAGALLHLLMGPIGFNVNQCSIAPRSMTAYHDGVQRQRSYLTIPLSQFRGQAAAISGAHMASFTSASHIARPTLNTHTGWVLCLVSCSVYLWVHTWKKVDSVVAVVLPRHRQLGQMSRWRNPLVYRPLVDRLTMEERHLLVTYRFDRATIQELCTQLEPDLMSPIRHPTGIPPDVQVLSEQVYRNRKSYHSMNVQMVCLADQYISQVNAMFPGSVHDAYILRNSSIPDMMGQLQRHHVWLLGDSGYPNLSWLLTPARNPRTRAEERYNEAHGRTRRVIERTFGHLKARFRCLHMTGGSLFYSPKKVCQIIIACSMLHNLALRRQVPFLQEDGPDDGVVAAVEPVDSDEEEAEEEDIDNRESVIQQYFP
ncbi:hypothetical protein NDU88_010053 [Pleurodeles waltl]|uniref:DDE Tnp4 domain-containing protein n=1 Tax=Pleurodeles waltl TaxID=8319 RepID=A0AAV7S1H0_PLEWA|nr:hypothetical protein NDU88_010053 [Pleurodeles waltl]